MNINLFPENHFPIIYVTRGVERKLSYDIENSRRGENINIIKLKHKRAILHNTDF